MRCVPIFALLMFANAALAAPARDTMKDVEAINNVMESFRTSLIAKDKPTYMGLFFSDKPEDIGWQFVSEDTRLEHIRLTKPDAIKARQIPANNFVALIDGVVATKEPREETFDDVKIETDGEIASVSFDYSFLANGEKTNWGREMWQLVRTEGGWKIYSVVYTIRDQWSRETGASTAPAEVLDYLLASAAADFRAHPPGAGPLRVRNARVGHAKNPDGAPSYRLCGQFQPGDAGAWTNFATIKTSGYEHYLGDTRYCEGLQWDGDADLSASLQQRLDAPGQ